MRAHDGLGFGVQGLGLSRREQGLSFVWGLRLLRRSYNLNPLLSVFPHIAQGPVELRGLCFCEQACCAQPTPSKSRFVTEVFLFSRMLCRASRAQNTWT